MEPGRPDGDDAWRGPQCDPAEDRSNALWAAAITRAVEDAPLTPDPLDDSALVAALQNAGLPTDLGYCLYSRALMTRPAVHALCGQLIAALAQATGTRRRLVRHYYLHADWEGLCMAAQRWQARDAARGAGRAYVFSAGHFSPAPLDSATIDALFGPPLLSTPHEHGPYLIGPPFTDEAEEPMPAAYGGSPADFAALIATLTARVEAAKASGRRINIVELGDRELRALEGGDWPGGLAGVPLQLQAAGVEEGIGLFWED